MNIRGKAWCPNCGKDQPATLVGLSINGAEKTVTGFCAVCEHPVQRTFAFETKRNVQRAINEDNCVPLNAYVLENNTQVPEAEDRSTEIERPSWVTLVALFSVCLVITYLL